MKDMEWYRIEPFWESKVSLCVLISCMNQTDRSIIAKTNIQTDVVVINQCNLNKIEEFTFRNSSNNLCRAKIISTTERGLSRSRNMALLNSYGDLCLLCDDDERLVDDYENIITSAFDRHRNTDIIAFSLKHPTRRYPNQSMSIGMFRSASIGSVQLVIKKSHKLEMVKFCEKMGSGTGNGAGEENKYLVDCLKLGAQIQYVPNLIAEVQQTNSQWFHGYDRKYWINFGWTSKMIFGYFWGSIYLVYRAIFRNHKVDKLNSSLSILGWTIKGYLLKR